MQFNTEVLQLVHSLLPKVTQMARTFNFHEADDIAQDVIIKLLCLPAGKAHLEIQNWLLAVVRNTAIDRQRKKSNEEKYLERYYSLNTITMVCEDSDGRQVYLPTTRDLAEDMEEFLLPRVRRMLNELPRENRRALILSVSGYSYAQIAEITGSKIGTVRSRVHYARKRAKQLLLH